MLNNFTRPCFAFGQVRASQCILFLYLKLGGENLFRCTNQDEKDLVLIAIIKIYLFLIPLKLIVKKCQLFYKYHILDHYNYKFHCNHS